MIRPNKHAHPDKTLMSAATVILRRVKARRSEKFDDLRKVLVSHEPDAASLFLPAVNLLFLLGLIEYRKKNDTFEYVGN
ncbi:ABC-three component system middle component 8 [Fuerstiella marisgermanici]|uniref:Uncharacterized protein n=1 Tax=Fuerstiella marisgermanici TaxID=1891926 RepID=A0A1P8WMS6_9PLAN|nr:ABC-three component system middle component 8 [Fuerstiella marisgermanici]APZ95366.1 hypothetical protein Fuma_05024 [Fuerstiella marisgermanici]